MTKDQEQLMLIAHQQGRQEAAEVFAQLVSTAMDRYRTRDEHYAFIAGCLGELRRIASKDLPDAWANCAANKEQL